MDQPIIETAAVPTVAPDLARIAALEAGKVLYFPALAFTPLPAEARLFTPAMRDPASRNISLDAGGRLRGAAGEAQSQAALAAMMLRFRAQAQALIAMLCPAYVDALRCGSTSFRPSLIETRAQSWRADDRRLHVDAFPSRPNRGERLLRVFANVHPDGVARVWRLGEPFEQVAQRFLPRAKRHSRMRARALHALGMTKSLRSEYDHLMLQLHDAMKADLDYQQHAPQKTVAFPSGSTWVCFSDQASHAAMSGQYLLELTMQLPPGRQYDTTASPLAILSRLTGRVLV
ncbi:MAG: Kdo hydroxylase family protein [Pseudomonadota bacterium]|nr:Kdo hydroxylase family protein [Pseudomonadota bacterium]